MMSKDRKPKETEKKLRQSYQPRKEKFLPKNIYKVGEQVMEDKNIYILQSVYKKIHSFSENKRTVETGGMLMGYTLEANDKLNIIINGFIEGKYSEGTPTTLKFTHETWDYVHKEAEKRFPQDSIIGWIHTHPDFGIFLSNYDIFIQQNFFNEPHQIAYVVDPIQDQEGFYFWKGDKIEKCPGFYIFSELGEEIEYPIKKETSINAVSIKDVSKPNLRLLRWIVVFQCVLMIAGFVMLSTRISQLNQSINTLNEQVAENYKDSISSIEKNINQLEKEINQHTVVFVSDGNVISKTDYYTGEKIVPPEIDIEKTDEQYIYRFEGWDKLVDYAFEDTVILAVYNKTPRMYKIEFRDENGNPITSQDYSYGEIVNEPDYIITRNQGEGIEVKWDKEITPVYKNTVYNAVVVNLPEESSSSSSTDPEIALDENIGKMHKIT